MRLITLKRLGRSAVVASPKYGIVALAFALSTIVYSAAAEASVSSDDPTPPSAMKGTFQRIDFGDPCETVDGIGFSLTTNYGDAAPLFALQTTLKGKCTWSIASVIHDRITPVASVAEDLWGVRPAAAADGTYWAALGGYYLHILADGMTIHVSPFKSGYNAKTIESVSTGAVYAIEEQHSTPKNTHMYVVNVSDGSMQSVPGSGWTENLDKGSDGQLYFKFFEDWRCHIFEVDRLGKPFDRLPCWWQSGRSIAVGQDGGIWEPGLLEVVEYDKSGKEIRSSGLIAPFPRVISNTAALQPRCIVADQRGNVYFEYQELWRLDKQGRLSKIDLPDKNLHIGAMVETADGSLWILASDWNNRGAFYRFTPAVQ